MYEQKAATSQADLDNVARNARIQANSLKNSKLPPLEQAQLKESAEMFAKAAATGRPVSRGDLDALDQKYRHERRTQAVRERDTIERSDQQPVQQPLVPIH